MNNRDYWAKRFRALEERANAEAEKCVAESMKLIQDEVTQIDKDINYWLRRYADNNNITLAEAKKSISNKELEELGWDVEEYIRKGRANSYTGEWTTELENASARYHLTRLDAIKLQIQKCCDTAFTGIVQNMTKSLSEVYKDVQYRAAYEIQKESGIYSSFAQVDENKLRMILERPWAVDGMNFSQRVWGSYRPKLTNKLQQALTDWCVRGTDPKKLAKALSYESGVAQSACNTLIRTETAQICTRAEMDCYDELGVEKYRILETLDDRTCDVCADMDGKVFKRSEYEVGITAPPFHPRCRGTTIPEVDDDLLKQGRMRAARNDKGKTTYVEDMSYKEWKEKFVGNDQFTNSSNNDIIKSGETVASGQSRANQIKTKNIIQRGIAEERPIFADGAFGKNIAKVKPEAGFYDVALHGTPIITNFFGTAIDSHTLAEIIKNRKDYTGEPIRLLSCNTGNSTSNANCFAQRLANELKVEVKAPNNIIWAYSDGRISIGKTHTDKSGEFILFKPTPKE